MTYVLAQQQYELGRLEDFHEGLTSVLLGRLSPKLVPTDALKSALERVQLWATANNVKGQAFTP